MTDKISVMYAADMLGIKLMGKTPHVAGVSMGCKEQNWCVFVSIDSTEVNDIKNILKEIESPFGGFDIHIKLSDTPRFA